MGGNICSAVIGLILSALYYKSEEDCHSSYNFVIKWTIFFMLVLGPATFVILYVFVRSVKVCHIQTARCVSFMFTIFYTCWYLYALIVYFEHFKVCKEESFKQWLAMTIIAILGAL